MKVLLTGGTGFIGQHLLRALCAAGHSCRVLARPESDLTPLADLTLEVVRGDVTDPPSLRGIADGMDVVYHLAAAGHVSAQSADAYARFRALNVDGTRHLIAACRGSGISRFIHFSSTAAVGTVRRPIIDETTPCQPRTPYQRSKYESEQVVVAAWQEDRFPAVILRPCMVYGPGGKGEFLKICRLMARGIFPRVGSGANLTPIVHVRDVVQAASKAATRARPGEVYLVASAQSYPAATIRHHVLATLGLRRPYPYVPLWLALAGAHGLETVARWAGRTPPVTRQNIRSTVADRIFDISKAQRELDYQPSVLLEEGIRETVAWFRHEGVL